MEWWFDSIEEKFKDIAQIVGVGTLLLHTPVKEESGPSSPKSPHLKDSPLQNRLENGREAGGEESH